MPETTRSGETVATRRRVYFEAVDQVDLKTFISASDMGIGGAGSFTVKISKDGAAPATPSVATITEVDATNMKGLFYWDGAAADWQSCDKLTLRVSSSGGTKVMLARTVVTQVTQEDPYRPAYFGAVIAGTLTTAAFTTDRTETTTDAWRDALVEFLSGPNVGAVKKIGAYNGATKLITLATGLVLPAAPTAGDKFRLISR